MWRGLGHRTEFLHIRLAMNSLLLRSLCALPTCNLASPPSTLLAISTRYVFLSSYSAGDKQTRAKRFIGVISEGLQNRGDVGTTGIYLYGVSDSINIIYIINKYTSSIRNTQLTCGNKTCERSSRSVGSDIETEVGHPGPTRDAF